MCVSGHKICFWCRLASLNFMFSRQTKLSSLSHLFDCLFSSQSLRHFISQRRRAFYHYQSGLPTGRGVVSFSMAHFNQRGTVVSFSSSSINPWLCGRSYLGNVSQRSCHGHLTSTTNVQFRYCLVLYPQIIP